MKSLPLAAAALATALCCAAAHADQVYVYTGANFTQVSGTYNTGESISGWIKLDIAFPPNQSLVDASGHLVDFFFTDGVHQTREKTDTYVCAISLATDGNGNISDWTIFLREQPYTTGQPQNSLELYGHGTVRDQAGTVAAGNTVCEPQVMLTYGRRTAASPTNPWVKYVDVIFADGFDGPTGR